MPSGSQNFNNSQVFEKDPVFDKSQVFEGILIGIGALLALAVMANLRTISSIVLALLFSPRSHIRRSVDRQPEGFLQALRPEVILLTDMVYLDAVFEHFVTK